MRSILICFCMLYLTDGQKNVDKIVFTDRFQLPEGYEFITDKPLESLGALEKCGEGSTEGKEKCVPYYICDGPTRTIIDDGSTSGLTKIDIRFGANKCQETLDVCCGIPQNNVPPSSTEISPTSPIPPYTPDIPYTPKHCGIRNDNGVDFKITGNTNNEAEYGEFPWMVAILKKQYDKDVSTSAICGGSLIAPNVILTGAHCVYKYKTHELKIRAGEWDTQTTKERYPYQEREISEIIVHENFNPQTLFNDIALLILSEPVQQAPHIGTICLPRQDEIINSEHCFATGWGKDLFGRAGVYQVILKKIELPTVHHDLCQELLRKTRLGSHFILDSSFICAGGLGGKDTCTGDGGSPLVCPDSSNPGSYLQVGTVAWGIGCGEEHIPGVYGHVAKFRNWIDDHLNRLNIDSSSYIE